MSATSSLRLELSWPNKDKFRLTPRSPEIAKAEASIDRYLSAFENGTMPEATCAPRVEALSRKRR